MRLKKSRPYNHWLKSQGYYLSCFSTSKRSEPIRFACDMRLKTRYSLRATTKTPPILEKKNVPILRSQNTQSTRTPLKTGSEQSAQLLFIRQCNFDPFQIYQPTTRLISTYQSLNTLKKTKLRTRELEVTKLKSNSRIKYNNLRSLILTSFNKENKF